MKGLIISSPSGKLKKLKQIPLEKIDVIFLTGNLANTKKYSSELDNEKVMSYYISAVKVVEYLSKIAPVYTTFGKGECDCCSILKKLDDISLYKDLNEKIKNVAVVNNKSKTIGNTNFGFVRYYSDKFRKIEWTDILISGQNPFENEFLFEYIKKQSPREIYFGDSSKYYVKKIGKTKIFNLGKCGYKFLEI